jgi:hypothetical protein
LPFMVKVYSVCYLSVGLTLCNAVQLKSQLKGHQPGG